MSTHLWRGNGHYAHTSASVSSRPTPCVSRSRSRRRTRTEDRGVPMFLQQTHSEIKRKFQELDNLQNKRLEGCCRGESSQWRLDYSSEVVSRNRYSNIAAWDSNRVRLKVPSEHCDYINASPIALASRKDGTPKRYIATQGPKRGQFGHLWRMVWQETTEVAVIVMLTKTLELGRDKCFQYFPEKIEEEPWQINGDDEFGDGFKATIKLLEKYKDRKSSCTVRKMLMTVGEEEKMVWHLLFKGWPDYNVPEGDNKNALLELIRLANEKNSGPENPLVVHCSAGVGRSGTFITLDHFLREIDAGTISADEREDLIFETVNQLREQRMYMVQSHVQFDFLYQVLRERFQRRAKSASPPSQPFDDAAESSEVCDDEVDELALQS